jgi:hypothetical protein
LPTFLRELRPTMASLGSAADAQTPALENLNASAGQLTRLFENVPAFAKSSRSALKTLGDASRRGRPALVAARPTVAQLGEATAKMPEVANNLAIILEHLGDRRNAVEKDPRSPGGQGYTGFEAILQYFYDQTLAINIFDANTHILKVDLFESKCSDYQNLESLKEEMSKDPQFFSDCAAILGPNLPGITQPDPTATHASASTRKTSASSKDAKPKKRTAEDRKRGKRKDKDGKERVDAAEELRQRIQDILGITLPELPSAPLPALPSAGQSAPQVPSTADPQQLLDFLLAP